jgi:hypothetical protein
MVQPKAMSRQANLAVQTLREKLWKLHPLAPYLFLADIGLGSAFLIIPRYAATNGDIGGKK